MAITGSGTQADPYIVDNYNDLRAVCIGQGTYWTRGQQFYIQLDADIDATGIAWDLKGTVSPRTHLDLNGHTISNVTLSASGNNETFAFSGEELSGGTMTVRAENIYTYPFPSSPYQYADYCYIHDMNITILNATWQPQYEDYGYYYQNICIFFCCKLVRCIVEATYHLPVENDSIFPIPQFPDAPKGTNQSCYAFAMNTTRITGDDTWEDNDLILHWYGNYTYYRNDGAENCPSRYVAFYGTDLSYCRVRGQLLDSYSSLTWIMGRGAKYDTCVVEFDVSATEVQVDVIPGAATLFDATQSLPMIDTVAHITYPANENRWTAGADVIELTAAEIRNYTDLINVSFPVTPTGQEPPTGYRWFITNGDLPYLSNFAPAPVPTRYKIYKGDTPITIMYAGNATVDAVYCGDEQLYSIN